MSHPEEIIGPSQRAAPTTYEDNQHQSGRSLATTDGIRLADTGGYSTNSFRPETQGAQTYVDTYI
jgi:hypothetical protein